MVSTLTLPDGYELSYETAGRGGDRDPVVLLHDGILSMVAWDRLTSELTGSRRVVRYDRRGFGASATPEAPYSNEEDLLALLDALEIRRADVVAASGGGGVALALAVTHPERVGRLVLVGAALPGLSFSSQFHARAAQAFAPLVEARDMSGSIERWAADPWLVTGDRPGVRQKVRDLLSTHPRSLINPPELASPSALSAADLSGLDRDALVVVGSGDHPDVHAHAGAIAFTLPRAERVLIDDAGHFVYLERPNAFAEAVRAFLDGS